jgi:hypothetical protein
MNASGKNKKNRTLETHFYVLYTNKLFPKCHYLCPMQTLPEFPALTIPHYPFKTGISNGKPWIYDAFRKKEVALTPEEWVRQHFMAWLVLEHHYPMALIGLELSLSLHQMQKRCDALIYSPSGKPIAMVECKAPSVKISQNTFDQIARYNLVFKVDYLFVTNGLEHYACRFNYKNQQFDFIDHIPSYSEMQEALRS